ncbi:hypothetical protein [Streptomyces virginiae]|uniref:hypothetical protein n=1 Tax=Streptomyces virginiae TaxID=1961 RepID=UPI00343B8EB2
MPTTLVTRSMTAFLGGSAMGRDAVYGYGTAGWKLRGLSVLAMFTGGALGALLIRAGCAVGRLLLRPPSRCWWWAWPTGDRPRCTRGRPLAGNDRAELCHW